MVLSYLEEEEGEEMNEQDYYENLDSDSWSSSTIGTWKDLE